MGEEKEDTQVGMLGVCEDVAALTDAEPLLFDEEPLIFDSQFESGNLLSGPCTCLYER